MLPIFAYIGPETMLPLTSVLAVIGGAFLFFWRYTGGLILGFFKKSKDDDDTTPE